MFKLVNKAKNNNKGFTLVELIVVILIIAILAVALAPQVMKYINKSRVSADLDNAANLKTTINTAYADCATSSPSSIAMMGNTLTSFNVNNTGATNYEPANMGVLAVFIKEVVNGSQNWPKSKYDNNGFFCSYTSTGSVQVTCGATYVS